MAIKKIKKCFDEYLTFERMLKAHYRAKKHKAYKDEVILFEINLENNICNLVNNIRLGRYVVGKYRAFKVYEPKERVIRCLPYIDRVVHQWYVYEFIKKYIVPKMYCHSYACLDNRGIHKAKDIIQKYMRICKRNYRRILYIKM